MSSNRGNSKINSIVFDFDGVINDSATIERAGNRIIEIVRRNDIFVPENILDIFRKHWGIRGIDLLMISFNISEERAEEIYRLWEREGVKNPYPLIEGAENVLRKLRKQGYLLSILTNRNRKNVMDVISYYNIQGFFWTIRTLQDCAFVKPDPRALDFILGELRRTGILSENHLFIGDTPKDWECASGQNVKFVAVTTGMFKEEYFLKLGLDESRILKSVAELPEWLKKYN